MNSTTEQQTLLKYYYQPVLFFILCLASLTTAAQTSSMFINNNSLQAIYLTAANDHLPYHSRQQYSLIIAKERNPRNISLNAETELLDYSHPVMQTRILTPKIGLSFTDFLENNILALSGGVILRQPANTSHDYELLAEFMTGPHLTDQINTDDHDLDFSLAWTWHIKAQINVPLPDNAEFNVGFRKIEIRLENAHFESFETGLYIGLSKHF